MDLLAPLLSDPPNLSVIGGESSWAAIRENAGRYGVAPLIAYAVRQHVSAADRAWCDRLLTDSWMRHERMLGHLSYLLGLLTEQGIPVLSLKGPLLARRYYTPPFLRKPSMDLDIAVIEANLERACAALTKAGYTLDSPIAGALACSHHVTLSHPSRPHVEVHFKLSHQSIGIPVDVFFERAISWPLPNGQTAKVLAPADQLLHLILHLGQSRFGTLFHLHEIRLVRHAEPSGVLREAIRLAVEYHFCGVLKMLDTAFRIRFNEPFLPPDIHVPNTWLNRRLDASLYRSFELWSMPGRPLSLANRLWGRWLDFQITDRPADALRSFELLRHIARFQIGRRAWRTPKNLTYGPSYARETRLPDTEPRR